MPEAKAEQQQFEKILRRNISLPLITGVVSSILFVLVVLYLLANLRAVEHVQEVMARTSELGRFAADAEGGLRGFVISGDAQFLDAYEVAIPRFRAEAQTLRQQLADENGPVERLRRAEAIFGEYVNFSQQTIAQRRENSQSAYDRVQAGQGKRLTDALREELAGVMETERRSLRERSDRANNTAIAIVIAYVLVILTLKGTVAMQGRRDLLGMSERYGAALRQQGEHTRYLERQAWFRDAQNELAQALAGRQDLEGAARRTLDFLARRIGAPVGALYAIDERGMAARVASYGLAPEYEARRAQLSASHNLVTEVAASGNPLQLESLPAGYLQVASGVVEGPAASALIVPLQHEGEVRGVLELGLLRQPEPRDAELLERVAPVVASSLQAAQARQRLQSLLEETQQLNEELQVQQEELRTANEELEEQSRALKESQANLESQQAELEQTNLQLSEFAERVEEQRDALQHAQSELEKRAADLERASQYKSEFLANMSHELRTPLNSSLILAKLLADNPKRNLDAEQVRFAESIYSAGNDLLTLINDILDIAKVEAGKLEVRPEATSLRGMADALRSMFEPLAAKKGLALDVIVGGDVPGEIVTDGHRVEQILKNLLSNAVKFTERGSVALHIARQAPSNVVFEVRDSGVGIDPSQQELIFEAFRQADGTSSRKHGGTGLGLSISRDLARLLGGDISVTSAPGQGSTFTLTLPMQYTPATAPALPIQAAPRVPPTPAPTPAATRPPAASAPPFPDQRAEEPAGRKTVLVVEDDTRFAQILFDLARELGYRCVVAHHAEEGMRLAADLVPDAVLLDMQLPDGSGLSVLQHLKEDPRTRHIPVHVVSVDDKAETALQMGAIGYAFKPTSLEQLREVFDRLEDKLSQKLKRVLLVEDDPRQQESISHLIADTDVQITAASTGQDALDALASGVFDCMVTDLTLPDMSGQELLRRMASGESRSFPPVIVYTGRNLTRDEEAELLRYSRSIIIKGARSPERLLDEVTLFLHKVESQLSTERQRMLRTARSRDKVFESRRIMVVDDDVRNIFALTSALEQKGAEVVMARNGREALDKLAADDNVDLVLMDLMMPEMDGYTAMREIRKNPAWQRLPIIAVTAKAMKEDQQKCLEAGANDYLAKPIELDRLFSLMRVWMPKLERI